MVRILVVDRPTNRDVLHGDLVDGDRRVGEAADSAEALDAARTESAGRVVGDAVQYERLLRHAAELEREIGERRRTEQELRESEQLFRMMTDTVPAMFLMCNAEGRGIFANRRWSEFTGQAVSPGATVDFAEAVPPDDVEAVLQACTSRQPFLLEHRLRGADGSERWFLTSGVPRFDSGGTYLGYLAVLVDVTERRELEDQLRQAIKMETVGSLTGGIAHDFNNLLLPILFSSEILHEALTDPFLLQQTQVIEEAAERASHLTQRLLAFSRRQVLRPTAIDLNQLVSGLLNTLSRTLGGSIAVSFHAGDRLWPSIVDSSQIENAIVNLAVNARDAMPDGGRLVIETSNVEVEGPQAAADGDVKPGKYVRLAVSDTGVGMTAEVMARVFEPFFTTKDVGKGSGLGLSMVYGFVRQSGGHVRIASEPGRGTTVRLYLPRAEAAAATSKRPADQPAHPRGRERILVVEDEVAVRVAIERILRDLGYTVVTAGNGRQALLELDRSGGIDLVLTDVVMPDGMSGVALADAARKRRPSPKVLFMSGYPTGTPSGALLPDPAEPLLTKPFRPADVARRVRAALDG